ncbi:MAG: ornithine carbamoyltransferase, partial [Myxococcales bacterium]|nr:ornithine carbamoyltransferase [Myxococcales bacterium]
MTRHFRTLLDFSPTELLAVLDRAAELKRTRGTPQHPKPLANKSIAVLFDKASTRTRLSFEVGIHELGGQPLIVISKDTQLGRGEPIEDTARMLSRYCHGVVWRTFGHERIEALAATSTVPVINGLSDLHHPCQLLADLMTVREATGGRLYEVEVAWVGDGNNVANSWIHAAASLGMKLRLACPEGYEPPASVLEEARALGRGSVTIVRDPAEAVRGAHVVTTDVFTSMGQEDEAKARMQAFAGYMVDAKLMSLADPKAIFLHCLP